MNKNEFLDQLFRLLLDISPEERDEAIAYYREYIEDAGFENEEAVLEELGTPEEVAAEIKAGIFNKSSQNIAAPEPYSDDRRYHQSQKQPKKCSTAVMILGIIAALLLSPFLLGILGSIFGVVIGCFAAILGVILGFGIAGIVCFLGGIALFFWGIFTLWHNPAVSIGLVGAGLVVTALGILFLLLTGWICLVVLPWAIRCTSNLVHKFIHRNKEAQV